MPVITMTREMGSRGRDVAIGLAEALDLHLVHYQVVERHVAERLNLDAGAVHRYLEGGGNALSRWRLTRSGVDQCTAQEIFDLALRGNALIRGWGATHLLRDVPHVVSVRVCAPMEQRIATLISRVGLDSEEAAAKEIQANDAAHARVTSRFAGAQWDDPLLYDVVLNTARIPVSECIEQVRRLVELAEFRETAESRALLSALRQRHDPAAQATAPPTPRARGAYDSPVLREERDVVI